MYPTTYEQRGPDDGAVKTNSFDVEEIHGDCTVQILRNSVTGEVSVGWRENDVTVDFVCKALADWFDEPCNYGFGDVEVALFMISDGDTYRDQWCDSHCDEHDSAECWKRFFQLWKEREDGNDKA